jgi:membrane protein DedA with SNARE-associated domain
MEGINEFITELFFSVTPPMRTLIILALAFGEGLPVIGSFLPGGTIALLIGGLSEENFINPWFAVNLIALGSLAGDLIGFFAGMKLSNVSFIKRILESEKHESKWDLFDRHAALVIIFGKILPVVRSTPALFAGARKMNIWRYIGYVLIGSYLWAIGGIFGGRYLAQFFGSSAISIIIIISIILAVITFVSKSVKKKEHKAQEIEPGEE